MSGYHSRDRKLAEDVGDDFPALNNITIRGALPSDRVPAASKLNELFSLNSYLFFLFYSQIKNSSRSSFQITPFIQKMVQIYAICCKLDRLQKICLTRACKAKSCKTLESKQ